MLMPSDQITNKPGVLNCISKYQAKLKEVEGLILPLLYNLMKNPDKPMIKWANREPVIKRQIEKILAVTRGEDA